ncbi:radical SAM protein [Candidatus Woesearchaeota archaeon]|nr:radical SAM protein [Candidatus Woesearchaeota archaeon]
MKVLFIRPPRYMWPMNSESSSFWQPLGFASMAAVLREDGGFEVEILDCCIEKIGWRSLTKIIEKKSYDALCIGEEVSSVDEAFKLIKTSKHFHPDSLVICGGYYFTHMEKDLKRYPIDFIIKAEGEYTLLELLKEVKKSNPDYSNVKGIAYLSDGTVKVTPRRELCDMDKLPMPAYDLLKMELYGKDSKNHKDFVAMEHGRGCTFDCSFCSIWKIMDNNNTACYRTKSPEKTFAEVEHVVKKYKRKTINWVDGLHNANPKWFSDFTDLMAASDIKVQQTAWMRSDCIIRDHKSGVLRKAYDTGLVQANIGVERLDKESMDFIRKRNNYSNTSLEALEILREHYPNILRLITVIYGIPDETRKKMRMLTTLLDKRFSDVCFFIPYTPYPGTDVYNKLSSAGFLSRNFKDYNMIQPVLHTKKYSKEQVFRIMKAEIARKVFLTPSTYASFFKGGRRSKVQWSIAQKTFKYLFLNQTHVRPEWYEN